MEIPFSNNWNLLMKHELTYKEKVKKIQSICHMSGKFQAISNED